MADLENLSLTLSLVTILMSMILSVIAFINQQRSARTQSGHAVSGPLMLWNRAAIAMVVATVLLITLTIVSRAVQTKHGPFSNMYEFAISFAWGIVVAGFIFRWRYKTDSILNIGLFIALLLLIFARVKYAVPNPLVPALQQSTLLSIHVASAGVAYGTLTIGFGSAIMYLVQKRRNAPWLPELELLDNISYRAVVIGFPFLTLVILLGALWADIAWGRYWGWDPKETASLVTWLIYAAYLHARVMRGWRGIRSAWLLIIGFAAILLTFFGNYIFTGLHAY
ncbi:MAG: c-type cytochrome biogenesis protein CcsB [Clostridiaceae bacterium]|nr:c-type cytochrome biogenesis protein CcsB [Clostridiaceae bacterium]